MEEEDEEESGEEGREGGKEVGEKRQGAESNKAMLALQNRDPMVERFVLAAVRQGRMGEEDARKLIEKVLVPYVRRLARTAAAATPTTTMV